MSKQFDICMIGLGHVGTISAACFAKQGFNVIGVDTNPARVKSFENFEAPFTEPEVNDLIKDVIDSSKFRATTDCKFAVQNSDIIMIAVGTPTAKESGEPDLSFLDAVSKSIGQAFKDTNQAGTIIVVRSTVPPGTIRNRLTPIIETESGFKAGIDFHIAANPEFLREGKAIDDFFTTGRVVVGADNDSIADKILKLYTDEVIGKRITTTIESAEFAKYVDNTWHAVKVAFANEIGRMVTAFNGCIEDTTNIFLSDDKLNISKYYLRPGFAFGGSCLPKDVRGLNDFADKNGVNIPLIKSIMSSNEEQIDFGVAALLATGAKKIGLLGIAFKENIDDIRESPAIYVAAKLRAAGIEVFAHDPAHPKGSDINILRDGEKLDMVTLDELLASCDVFARFHNINEYMNLDNEKYKIINLTTILPN